MYPGHPDKPALVETASPRGTKPRRASGRRFFAANSPIGRPTTPLVVCVGMAKRVVRAGAASVELDTLYVIAWPKGQEKAVIAVEKIA